MDIFKKAFEKAANVGKAVQNVMKGWSPSKAEAGKKIVQKAQEMRAKGISMDQIRQTASKALAPAPKKTHADYLKSLGKATKSSPAPAGLSAHAQNQMSKMNPSSLYRKEGIGTNIQRVPGVKKDTGI